MVKTAHLDPKKKYVFGYHPHGVISVGALGSVLGNGVRTQDFTQSEKNADPETVDKKHPRGFSALFPGINRRLITLPLNFRFLNNLHQLLVVE